MAGKVIERDFGFNRIRDSFIRAGNPVVKVGIQSGEAKEEHTGDFGKGGKEPLTNLELGVIHEFGAPGASIPERSFIRAPVEANRRKYVRTMTIITKSVLAGITTVEKGLRLLGLQVEKDMKGAFDKGLKPPLKPATISARNRKAKGTKKAKGKKPSGSAKPLLDTAQLRNSITHVVMKTKGLFR